MKSFRFYKSDFKKLKNLGISEFFELFKKPIFLTILISALIGLIAGSLGGAYIQYLTVSREEIKKQQDLFLETQKEAVKIRAMKSIPEVVKEASPAVVSVIVSKLITILERDYFNPFGENSPFNIRIPIIREKGKELKEIGGGTGFIVSSDGLIVTNKHVVLEEEAEYTVLTNDGQKYSAEVLDRDPIQDIAVLKIEADNLPTLKLGNSDKLEIGQTVIAIGNALGEFRNTVSAGVISGLLRTITATGGDFSEQLEEVIQTDAAINQGNSGGPLLNLYSEVIGVNTARAPAAENIGFAIPINKIKKAINDVKTRGEIVYPFLGIRYVLINEALVEAQDLSVNYGVLIIKGDNPEEVAIVPGSGADKAGLKEGDIIIEIDNKRINENNPLAKLILKYYPKDEVSLKVLRDGEEIIVKVILGEWE